MKRWTGCVTCSHPQKLHKFKHTITVPCWDINWCPKQNQSHLTTCLAWRLTIKITQIQANLCSWCSDAACVTQRSCVGHYEHWPDSSVPPDPCQTPLGGGRQEWWPVSSHASLLSSVSAQRHRKTGDWQA